MEKRIEVVSVSVGSFWRLEQQGETMYRQFAAGVIGDFGTQLKMLQAWQPVDSKQIGLDEEQVGTSSHCLPPRRQPD